MRTDTSRITCTPYGRRSYSRQVLPPSRLPPKLQAMPKIFLPSSLLPAGKGRIERLLQRHVAEGEGRSNKQRSLPPLDPPLKAGGTKDVHP